MSAHVFAPPKKVCWECNHQTRIWVILGWWGKLAGLDRLKMGCTIQITGIWTQVTAHVIERSITILYVPAISDILRKNGKVTPIQFPSFARAAGLHLTAPGCQRPASRWRIDLWDSLGSTLQLEKQQLVFVQGWNSLKINNPTPICNTLQKHAKAMIDHLGGVGYWGEGID